MAPLDLRRAAALSRLAAAYARHVARRVSRTAPGGGGAEFARLYAPERITAITPAEREAFAAHGRCVGCGLCAFAALRAGHLRADRLASQLTRSLPELWTLRDQPLDAVDWAAGAAVCPLGVPLGEMAALTEARLRRDGTAAPPPPQPIRVEPGPHPPRR